MEGEGCGVGSRCRGSRRGGRISICPRVPSSPVPRRKLPGLGLLDGASCLSARRIRALCGNLGRDAMQALVAVHTPRGELARFVHGYRGGRHRRYGDIADVGSTLRSTESKLLAALRRLATRLRTVFALVCPATHGCLSRWRPSGFLGLPSNVSIGRGPPACASIPPPVRMVNGSASSEALCQRSRRASGGGSQACRCQRAFRICGASFGTRTRTGRCGRAPGGTRGTAWTPIEGRLGARAQSMAEALILDSDAVAALARPTERRGLAERAGAILRVVTQSVR